MNTLQYFHIVLKSHTFNVLILVFMLNYQIISVCSKELDIRNVLLGRIATALYAVHCSIRKRPIVSSKQIASKFGRCDRPSQIRYMLHRNRPLKLFRSILSKKRAKIGRRGTVCPLETCLWHEWPSWLARPHQVLPSYSYLLLFLLHLLLHCTEVLFYCTVPLPCFST